MTVRAGSGGDVVTASNGAVTVDGTAARARPHLTGAWPMSSTAARAPAIATGRGADQVDALVTGNPTEFAAAPGATSWTPIGTTAWWAASRRRKAGPAAP